MDWIESNERMYAHDQSVDAEVPSDHADFYLW